MYLAGTRLRLNETAAWYGSDQARTLADHIVPGNGRPAAGPRAASTPAPRSPLRGPVVRVAGVGRLGCRLSLGFRLTLGRRRSLFARIASVTKNGARAVTGFFRADLP